MLKDQGLMIYHFYQKERKLKKVEKLVTKSTDQTECYTHKKFNKKTLNHGLFLKKLHGVIKSNENPWQKPYVDTNTDLRKEAKNDFEKSFLR